MELNETNSMTAEIAEQYLRVAQEHFGPNFSRSSQPMVLMDKEFRLLSSNDAAKLATGHHTGHSWLGRRISDQTFQLTNEEQSIAAIIDMLSGKIETTELEGVMQTLNDEQRIVRISVHAIRDDDGAVEYVAGYMNDITDLRWAERVLADQLRIETVVAEIGTDLMAVTRPEALIETISHAIQELGRISNADRAFYWRFDQGSGEASLLLDWGRAGAQTVPLLQRSMPTAEFNAVLPPALLRRPASTPSTNIPGLAQLAGAEDLQVLCAPVFGGADGDVVEALVGLAVTHAELRTVDEQDVNHLARLFSSSHQQLAKRRSEERRASFSKFITETGTQFLTPDSVAGDGRIEAALAELGRRLGAQHVQLRDVDWAQMVSTVSEEWSELPSDRPSILTQFDVIDLHDPAMREIASKTEPFEFRTTDVDIDGASPKPTLVLSVPLVIDDVVTATLNIVASGADPFTDDEIWAAGTLAGLIVQLQRRTAAEAELRQRLDLEDMVRTMAINFNELTAETIEAGLARALRRIGEALDVQSVALCRLDQEHERISLAALWTSPHNPSLAHRVYTTADRATTTRLLRSVAPLFLSKDSLPDVFAELVPDHTHIAHIPVVRGGVPLLSLDLEADSSRVWTDAELGAIRSISALIVQLDARIEAQCSVIRRLELEDLTRKIATDFLNVASDAAGLGPALSELAAGLGANGVVLWRIDHERSVCTLRDQWGFDWVPEFTERRFDGDLALLALAQAEESTTQSFPASALPIALDGEATSGSVVYATLNAAEGPAQALLGFTRDTDEVWTEEEIGAIESVASMIVQLEARLEAEEYFTSAFENAPVGVTMRDDQGRLLACNPAYEAFIGSTQQQMLGETDDRFRPHGSSDHETNEEVAFRRADGKMVWAKVSTTLVKRPNGETKLVLSHIEDTTERRRAVEQLEYRASHDELTGLVNRRVMLDEIRSCLSDPPQPEEAAILLLDLDRFKVANDSLGHSAGDDILRTVANRLRFAVRPGDVVSRLGGDEFVILLRGPVDHLEATSVAERLLSLIGKPIETGGGEVQTTCSVGIAFPNPADASIEDVMRHADAAMYQAKSRGRDRYMVFDEEHREALAQRVRREQELRIAVDNQQLELFFQPEIELTTGRILGAEGLVRWNHPELGLLTAGSFIELAEESGLVVEIGRFVLNQACRQAAEWNADDSFSHRLMVRANVSARQLERTELVEEVKMALRDSGLSADQLCLEITETALMADVDDSLRILQALKDIGVRLAIDDFGTGFSSLAYLKRFPVDVLKIDQAFVCGLGTDPDDEAIVQSVLSMADSLDLDVVAEGIETDEQRQMLVDMGCIRGQGFGMVRPAHPADLEPLLRRGYIDVAARTNTTS